MFKFLKTLAFSVTPKVFIFWVILGIIAGFVNKVEPLYTRMNPASVSFTGRTQLGELAEATLDVLYTPVWQGITGGLKEKPVSTRVQNGLNATTETVETLKNEGAPLVELILTNLGTLVMIGILIMIIISWIREGSFLRALDIFFKGMMDTINNHKIPSAVATILVLGGNLFSTHKNTIMNDPWMPTLAVVAFVGIVLYTKRQAIGGGTAKIATVLLLVVIVVFVVSMMAPPQLVQAVQNVPIIGSTANVGHTTGAMVTANGGDQIANAGGFSLTPTMGMFALFLLLTLILVIF